MNTLTGKQKRYLRSLGNRLDATVHVGKNGLNTAVQESLAQAFSNTELVKVRLQEGFEGDRHQAATDVATSVGAALVQVLGRTVLLYKPDPDSPEIKLPAAS